MKRRFNCVAVLVLVFSLWSVCAAQDSDKALRRFHRVNENLYRSAQPRISDGFLKIKNMGIKTVINLRRDDENENKEETAVKAAGLRYFNVPLGRMGSPKDEQIEKILSIINAPENQPVLVHCKFGKDRTGTVIAIYRITQDGWTGEQAVDEARRYGMRFWKLGMKRYIRNYAKRFNEQRKRSSAPGSKSVLWALSN
jgi:uncharacterized protein (TIGR01244 family)